MVRAPGPGLSPSLPPAMAAMAAELVALRREIDAVKRGMRNAQLANSSVENGTITFNDDSGSPQMLVGAQADGTHAIVAVGDGAPDMPSTPGVLPGIGSLFVTWDGDMADGSSPLSDFAYMQVTCTPAGPPIVSGPGGGQPQQPSVVMTQLTGPGLIVVGSLNPYQPYAVTFNMVNQAGNLSEPSAPALGTPQGVIDNIVAGTITASLLESGIIIAGAVNGTTITGAQFIAFGGDGELLMYASDPSLGGMLTASMSTVDNTDQYGNAYIHGVISYTKGTGTYIPSGTYVAQGWQDGQQTFASASSAGGPYTVASGSLRNLFGALNTGYSEGTDLNGTSDPVTMTQLDARTIAVGGRVIIGSAWTSQSSMANLSTTGFILPPSPAPPGIVPEYTVTTSGGTHSGVAMLRPSGGFLLSSTNFVNGDQVCMSGTLRW